MLSSTVWVSGPYDLISVLQGHTPGGGEACSYRKQMVKVAPRLREEASGSVGSGVLWILGIDPGVSAGGPVIWSVCQE